jgi:hypothetical protein
VQVSHTPHHLDIAFDDSNRACSRVAASFVTLPGPREATVYRLLGIKHLTCPKHNAWPQHSRWTSFRRAGHLESHEHRWIWLGVPLPLTGAQRLARQTDLDRYSATRRGYRAR